MWDQTKPMQNQVAKLMGPTWGPPGSCRPQMCPMLAPWTLLPGKVLREKFIQSMTLYRAQTIAAASAVTMNEMFPRIGETLGTIVHTMVKSWFEERGSVGSLIIMLQESGYKRWFLIYRRSPLLGFGDEKTVGKFRYDSCGRRTQGN